MNTELQHIIRISLFRVKVTLKDAPEGFLEFEAGNNVRKPVEILQHMVDVWNYVLYSIARVNADKSGTHLESLEKCHDLLIEKLAVTEIPEAVSQKIINGPVSDFLTHAGQLATLRRLSGRPVAGVNYPKLQLDGKKAAELNP